MYQLSITDLERKFFERSRDFKNYQNIDLNRKKEIETDAQIFKNNHLSRKNYLDENIGLYRQALLYLTEPKTSFKYKTFDEKVLFLITTVDPNLEIFNAFLRYDIPSLDDINQMAEEEQEKEITKRNTNIADFIETIRRKIGISNHRLLRFESILSRRFTKEFKNNIKKNYLNTILEYAANVKDFSTITDEDFAKITLIASYYLAKVNYETTPNTTAYNIISLKRRLQLNTLAEQLAFFINITDPELNILRIYEEESRIPIIKKRATEEIGYYNDDIRRLEQDYQKRFFPDKKVSAWSK